MFQRNIIVFLLFFCSFCHVETVCGQSDTIPDIQPVSKKTIEKVPVAPFGDTLFYISSNLGPFSAEERAVSITKKIRTVNKETGFHSDSIKAIASENIVEVVFQDIIIMSVTPADASVLKTSQIALAQKYAKIIGNAITEHERITNWQYILLRIALVVLIITLFFLAIKLLNKLFRRISDNIRKLKGRKIKPIKLKTFNLMDEDRVTKLIISGVKIVKYFIFAILFYLSVTLIFSVFPPTRGIADKLWGYVLYPVQKILMSIVGYIPNLITITIIFFVFRYLIKGLRYFAEEIDKGRITIKGFYSDWAHPSFNIIRTLLYAFMFIIIFPYLPGSESSIFKGVSVFLGIIFSLGSTSLISNVVSGLVLTYMRPFKIGDRIKIGEVVGNVIEKTPFVTRIKTPKNEEVTVPNSSVMSAQTFNYSHSAKIHGLILHTKVTFSYDTSWRQVHKLLLEAAARTSDVMKERKPFVLQTALDDFYAEYQINIFIEDADKMTVIYSELNQHIQDVFNEAGLELVVPHYAAHRDGNRATIPSEYLPKDYHEPSFNVKIMDTEKNMEK